MVLSVSLLLLLLLSTLTSADLNPRSGSVARKNVPRRTKEFDGPYIYTMMIMMLKGVTVTLEVEEFGNPERMTSQSWGRSQWDLVVTV